MRQLPGTWLGAKAVSGRDLEEGYRYTDALPTYNLLTEQKNSRTSDALVVNIYCQDQDQWLTLAGVH